MVSQANILNKEMALKAAFPLVEGGLGTQAVHDAVVRLQANRRSGTASTKTKATVSFSGVKPWRQKGTGRARAGYRSSPIWRKGGVVFGPHPRDYSKKMPRQMRKLAFRKALSERILAGDVVLVEQLQLSKPKTREFLQMMKAIQVEAPVLFVNDKIDPVVLKASRNLQNVGVTTPEDLNVEQVLRYGKVVFTAAAFSRVSRRAQ